MKQKRYYKIFDFRGWYPFLSLIDFTLHPIFLFICIPLLISAHGEGYVSIFLLVMAALALGQVLNVGCSQASLQLLSSQDVIQRSVAQSSVWYRHMINQSAIWAAVAVLLWLSDGLYKYDSLVDPQTFLFLVGALLIEQIDLQISSEIKILDYVKIVNVIDILSKLFLYVLASQLIEEKDFLLYFCVILFAIYLLRVLVKLSSRWFLVRKASTRPAAQDLAKNFDRKRLMKIALGFFVLSLNAYILVLIERWVLPWKLGVESAAEIAIASQLVFFSHSLPAASMAFLLPKLSIGASNFSFRQMFSWCLLLTGFFFGGAVVFVELYVDQWYAAENNIRAIFWMLAPGVLIYSLAIVPYFYVSSTSKVIKMSMAGLGVSIIYCLVISTVGQKLFTLEFFVVVKTLTLIIQGAIICGFKYKLEAGQWPVARSN